MPRPLPCLCVVCALLAAPTAAAFEFEFPGLQTPSSFQITLKSFFDYHDQNHNADPWDDEYMDLRNSLNLKLSVDRFSVSARFDTNSYFAAWAPSVLKEYGQSPYVPRYREEKISAAYKGRDLNVTLGDFYASIGRGLALNIRKTDLIGEDNTLIGAKVRYRRGDLDLLALSGLSNVSNLNLYEKAVSDPYDLISAGRIAYRIAKTVTLGLHGVGFVFDPFETNPQVLAVGGLVPQWAAVGGFSADAPGLLDGALDAYLEFNWLGERLFPMHGGDFRQGLAAYASASLSLGDVSILLEAKHYDDYLIAAQTDEEGGDATSVRIHYVRPPTLEPDSMEVLNNADVSGGRFNIDYRPMGGDTLLFVAYSGFWGRDRPGGRWIYNLGLGAEQDFLKTGRARLEVGLREEHPEWEDGDHHHLIYLDAGLQVPLNSRHSLGLHGKNWIVHTHFSGIDVDYLLGDWTLGWSWSPWLSASLIFGYNTEPSTSTDDYDFSSFYDRGRGPERQLFLAGSLTIDLWGEYVIRLLAGQIRGGPLCIDGVCRVLPPFAGVRTDVTLRF
jgi:hypothetical protein